MGGGGGKLPLVICCSPQDKLFGQPHCCNLVTFHSHQFLIFAAIQKVSDDSMMVVTHSCKLNNILVKKLKFYLILLEPDNLKLNWILLLHNYYTILIKFYELHHLSLPSLPPCDIWLPTWLYQARCWLASSESQNGQWDTSDACRLLPFHHYMLNFTFQVHAHKVMSQIHAAMRPSGRSM